MRAAVRKGRLDAGDRVLVNGAGPPPSPAVAPILWWWTCSPR